MDISKPLPKFIISPFIFLALMHEINPLTVSSIKLKSLVVSMDPSLIDLLPETITLPSSTELASKKLTEQIKVLSDYVVLIKVK